MRQEHSNSKFDKKLREKFENAEFLPPSFNKLMSGVQDKWEDAWTNNAPNQLLNWRSVLVYSIGLCLLFPLLVLKSDHPSIPEAAFVAGQSAHSTQQELNLLQKEALLADKKTNQLLQQNDINKVEARTDKAIPVIAENSDSPTTKDKKTSFTKIASEATLGEVIPKRNHKKFFETNPSQHEASLSGARRVISLLGNHTKQLPVIQSAHQKETAYTHLLLPNPKKGEWYVGLVGSIYSPWILNQNTYGAFNGYEFAYEFNFEQKMKLRVGYNAFGKLGAEIGFVANSHQGQHYEDNILGKLQTREVSLDYWQIPAHVKYRTHLGQGRQIPAIMNFELGLIYNHLKSAKEIINHGVGTDISERFKQQMMQVSFGVSTDFYFHERFFATIGFKSHVSNDINAPGWQVDDRYGKSHSMLLEAEVGISYRLSK